jgi:hypothetical protein
MRRKNKKKGYYGHLPSYPHYEKLSRRICSINTITVEVVSATTTILPNVHKKTILPNAPVICDNIRNFV